MLNLKKLIASVSAVAVMLTSVATTTFAATYTDVAEDSVYYEAVESLGKLGIVTGYEDGTYKPEETVTRAEMAALIARIQGYEETAKAGANTIFTDVAAEHWASGYVAQATNQGIINGYGDGTFGPEDPVLYEQAIKMIMSTLGYAPYAINNGDYPTGYLAAASRYEVTKGVSNAVIGTGANRGTIAQLLANAIDTPLMAQSKWNTDGSVEYSIYDGTDNVYKTLMSENLGVVKLKGVVTANTVTDLYAAKDIDTTEAAEVEIDITGNFDTSNKDFEPVYNTNGIQTGYAHDGKFLVADSDAEAFLGEAVIFYVVENEDEDMYEILSIAADSTKNDVLTFTLDQFDEIVADSTGDYTTIRYYKNETDKTSTKKTLDDSACVVYNGVGGQSIDTILSTSAAAGYVAANGKSLYGGLVTLIDNDGVTGYDVVMVEIASTAVVKKVTEDTIAFKKGIALADGGSMGEIIVDAEDETTVVTILKDGEAVDFSTLVEWDVLSVIAASDDADYIIAEVISNPVVGTITADFTSKTSWHNKGFRIDGNKYDVAVNAYEASNLAVGDGGTFYIDKYGKIAAFNEDSALATGVAGNYGFVTKAIVEDDPIDGQTVTMQLITANGIEVFDLATSVKFKSAAQDTTKKPADAVISGTDTPETAADTFFGESSSLKGQVIKYTKNSNGYINSITLAGASDKFATSVSASGIYDAENFRIGTTYVEEDAMVFFVDFEDTAKTIYDTDSSILGAVSDLEDETSYTVLAAYIDNKSDDNNIIVIEGGLKAVSPSTSIAVLTDVANGENEDGDEIYTLSYLIDGEEVTADTVGTGDLTKNFTDLTVGDVVKVKVNSAGKITSLNAVWDLTEAVRSGAEDLRFVYANIAGTNEAFDGGVVTNYKDNTELATFASGNEFKLSRAENVYVIDATGRNVVVKNGTSSNFKYYEDFYKTGYDVAVSIDGVVQETIASNDPAKFAKYTDYVFVRTYETKVKDIVIVKGPADVRTKATVQSSGSSN